MPSGHRVFIGNIPNDCRAKDVEKFFKGYGKFGEISIKRGFGFIEFDDRRDAEDAVQDLNGKEMHGSGRLRVELARSRGFGNDRNRSPRRERGGGGGGGGGSGGGRRDDRRRPGKRTQYRLIIENLSSKTSWQDLKDYFREAGDITYANAHKPKSGEGIVEFGERRGMEYALEKLDGTDLDGRKIRLVEEKTSKRSRSDSRSRSRSRSRS